MKYIAKTFSYLKKSFWLLALTMLPSAVLFGIFVRPLGFVTFIPAYTATDVSSFGDIAWLIFDRNVTVFVFPIILLFVVLTLCSALALSVIEKHFRTGRLMLKAPVQDINSSLFPTLKTIAVMTVAYMLMKFIFAGLTTLLHFLISGSGAPSTLNTIITAVVIVVLFFLLLFIGMPSLLWAPLMLTFGYSFVDALIAASREAAKDVFGLFIAMAFPFVVVIMLQYVVEFLALHTIANMAIAVVLYLFLTVYTVSLMMVATFELTGLERRDIKKKYL